MIGDVGMVMALQTVRVRLIHADKFTVHSEHDTVISILIVVGTCTRSCVAAELRAAKPATRLCTAKPRII